MPLETVPFDAAEFLDTPEAQAAYLSIVLAENDPAAFRHAVGVIARAQGMVEVARKADLSRPSLYRALGEEGNPGFDTMQKVLEALGMRLSVVPA